MERQAVIRARRDGWQVIVYTGIDPVTGRQRQISRQVKGSRKQAERVETRLKAEVMAGRHRGTAAKTLGEMVDVFLEWREQNGKPIGPRTIQGYHALHEARIRPGIGKLRLPQVDPPALDRFYTALRKSGSLRKPGTPLSGSRLRDVHAVISGALGLAARYGWVPYNAAALVRPPAPRGAKRAMPTREQAREALTAAERKDPELYLFLRLEAGELIVGYNVVHAKGLPDGYLRKRTKSRHGDDRPIALDDRTVALLREHRDRCEARAGEWGGELAADVYVFSADEAGRRPLRVDTMTRRFGELAQGLGHGYTLYGFRHFVATQLGAVATTATIRERMGHGSLEVTGGYVHRVSEADREAARHMAKLFDRQGQPS